MSDNEIKFELPGNIERYLALLSKIYEQDGKRQLQEIIVNSQIRIVDGSAYYEHWDVETFGHALYLTIPEEIYLKVVKQKNSLQEQIEKDLNKLHNVQGEIIDRVFLEIEDISNRDWRRDSGLLLSGTRLVPPDAEKRIWLDNNFRIFLSHRASVKKQTSELKDRLAPFGISCFVAHEDIHPTKAWQDEIENALSSMDALVALITEDFHNSDWTDQEIGYAFGRGIPIISIKLGRDPYGFLGKFQALSCSWETAYKELLKILLKHDRMLNAYINAIKNCGSWERGNILSLALPFIENISNQQVEHLIHVFNEDYHISGSYGFNGKYPHRYGEGLAYHLTRLTNRTYEILESGEIGLAN
jgi:Fe-S cluster biosynthesis and repair protein YggX